PAPSSAGRAPEPRRRSVTGVCRGGGRRPHGRRVVGGGGGDGFLGLVADVPGALLGVFDDLRCRALGGFGHAACGFLGAVEHATDRLTQVGGLRGELVVQGLGAERGQSEHDETEEESHGATPWTGRVQPPSYPTRRVLTPRSGGSRRDRRDGWCAARAGAGR